MDVFDSNTNWEDRAFYFSGKLDAPVIGKVWCLRSEDEYDSTEQPELMAMILVRNFVECIGKRPFLILASDAGVPTAVRSKKSVLWNHKVLRQLPHVTFEIPCEDGQTRLGAIVDLSEFGFDSGSSALLNWLKGLIVLTTASLENLQDLTSQWVSTNANSSFPFDYNAIAATLRQDTSNGILRYLPPGNSRPETVVVVAGDRLVDEDACRCIDLRR